MRAMLGLFITLLVLLVAGSAPAHAQIQWSAGGTNGSSEVYPRAVEYKQSYAYIKSNAKFKAWMDRSFENRIEVSSGTCVFRNFNLDRVLADLAGPCSFTKQELQRSLATPLVFRATLVGRQGLMYENSQHHMKCAPSPAFKGGPWDGRGFVCFTSKQTYSYGADTLDGNQYGFYVVDLEYDGRYVPMNGFDRRWLYKDGVRQLGNLPDGL